MKSFHSDRTVTKTVCQICEHISNTCTHIYISRLHLYTVSFALIVIQTPSFVSVQRENCMSLICLSMSSTEALSSFFSPCHHSHFFLVAYPERIKELHVAWNHTPNSFLLHTHVCVYMLCVGYMPMQPRGQPQVIIPQVQSIFLRQDFLKLGWLPSKSPKPPAFYFPQLGLQACATKHAFFIMGPRNWTQILLLARQVPYWLSYPATIFLSGEVHGIYVNHWMASLTTLNDLYGDFLTLTVWIQIWGFGVAWGL